jgi:NADH-quinone oxidoreductase subunit A
MPTLLAYCLLFTVVGVIFIFAHLMLGKIVRPAKPEAEKMTVYECGEPTVGSAWVQFDLRYYVVALLFVIFEVEVAFFFPWAVVFGKLNALGDPYFDGPERLQVAQALVPEHALAGTQDAASQATAATTLSWVAFADIMVFFGVLLVGFAYLWRRGDINWVRSIEAEERPKAEPAFDPPADLTRPPVIEVGQSV